MISKEIFRQYDIRGVVPSQFNAETAAYISNALGWQIKKKSGKINPTVSVGRDNRLSSNEIFGGVKRGLIDAGVNVIELGVCPTPSTYFSSFMLNIDGFVMITGSHNPPEYNGLKLGYKKNTYHSEKIFSIYKDISNNGYKDEKIKGKKSAFNIVESYIEWIVDHFQDLRQKILKLDKKVNVVIDAGNGVASNVAPKIFTALGVNVIDLFCEEDGDFPNHHPDPTVKANLQDAIEKVRESNADFAVAYDGDADRLGVLDEKGTIIWGDMLLLIYAKEIKKYYDKPKIIADVKASQVLFDKLHDMNIEGIMWKTGHSLIKEKLKEENAELAGEMSGHIFFADKYFGFDDAIYSSVRFLEAYVNALEIGEIKRCSEMFSDIPAVYNTPEIRLEFPENLKFIAVDKLKDIFFQYKNDKKYNIKDIIDIDGIRVIFENGWGLLRASNTQPEIVMRFEAINETDMNRYKNLIEGELSKIRQ